jgi:preprotein translocase subunit SecD
MSVGYRALILAVLSAAALVIVLPTFVSPPPAWWPWKRPVRLGLDLQGGTHLLYQVQIEQAIDNSVDRLAREVEREVRDAGVGAFTAERVERALHVRLANREKRAEARKWVQDRFPNMTVQESAGPTRPTWRSS